MRVAGAQYETGHLGAATLARFGTRPRERESKKENREISNLPVHASPAARQEAACERGSGEVRSRQLLASFPMALHLLSEHRIRFRVGFVRRSLTLSLCPTPKYLIKGERGLNLEANRQEYHPNAVIHE